MRRAYVIFTSSLVLIAASVLCLLLSVGAQGTEAEARVINHNSYIKPFGLTTEDGKVYQGNFYHVIGVIQVTGTKNIKDVGVELTFYDAEGEQIVAGPVMSMLGSFRIEDGVKIPENLLGPGDKLPFHIVLLDEGASAKVCVL